MAPAPINMVRP